MNFSTNLQITRKGADEIKLRTYKLNIKRRSVLILLDRPQSIEYILSKAVFPREDIIDAIQDLLGNGFVEVSEHGATDRNMAFPSAGGNLSLDDEIILSEAKFLLIDFCVDSFGTQSEAFSNGIGACKKVRDLNLHLVNIIAATQKNCPGRMPALIAMIQKINETA